MYPHRCVSCCVKVALLGVFVLFCFGGGCSRSHYRKKADAEAYSLVKTVASDPRWKLKNYTIGADRDSRYYDPYNPDCEPMPYDDPTAHRLMRKVDGMKGSDAWKKYGRTPYTENPYWMQYLSVDENGAILLDKETAVRLALKHSPNYQAVVENLYLSALNVSTQRFAFDTKFYGGDSLFYTATGQPRTTLENDADFGFTRKFATGAELAAGIANSLTWQFNGNDTFFPKTVLDFSLVQPLLRGGGRATVLENLTQAERNLLADVRRMVYFQQSFYVATVIGSGGVSGPGGISPGGGAGGYYSLLSDQVQIENQKQNIASLEDTLNRVSQLVLAGRTNQTQIDIDRNRMSLLTSQNELVQKKGSFEQKVETYLRFLGLPPDLQVRVHDPLLEQFELMSASVRKLQEDTNLILGSLRNEERAVPEDIRAQIPGLTERLLQEMLIVERDVERLENSVEKRTENLLSLASLPAIQNGEVSESVSSIPDFLARVEQLRQFLPEKKKEIERIVQLNRHFISHSREQLTSMIESENLDAETLWNLYRLNMSDVLPILHEEFQDIEKTRFAPRLDPLIQKRRLLQTRLNLLSTQISTHDGGETRTLQEEKLLLEQQMKAVLEETASVEEEKDKIVWNRIERWVAGDRILFSGKTFEQREQELREEEELKLQLIQEAQSGSFHLFRTPETYRNWVSRIVGRLATEVNDLMIHQAQARLNSITLDPVSMDAETAFQIASENRLDWMNRRAQLVDTWRQLELTAHDLKGVLDLEINGSIETSGNNMAKFDKKTGNITMGLRWSSPLTRLIEQNAYREALIRYQQARREYYSYVDGIKATMLNSVRDIQVDQLSFEIQRESIFISISSVELANLNLEKPGGEINVTATRDLLDSLKQLLDAQNSFMSNWVGYLGRRMQLELDMGVLRLDSEGMWVDSAQSMSRLNPSAPQPQYPTPIPPQPMDPHLPALPQAPQPQVM